MPLIKHYPSTRKQLLAGGAFTLSYEDRHATGSVFQFKMS